MPHPRRLLLPLLLPLLACALPLAAKDPVVGCSVRVSSRHPELAKRMETAVARAVAADPALDLRPPAVVNGYRVALDADIACPLDLFQGFDSAYIRLDGPGDDTRALCLSYPSRPFHDLKPDEQERLIAIVADRVVRAIKQRAGLLPGDPALAPGPYANREEIRLDASRPLQVEILRDPAESRLEEIALRDPSRWARDRSRLLEQAKPSDGRPAPEAVLASTTDPARSFDVIRAELPGTRDPRARARLLRELALMYREAGDRDEAVWFARRAADERGGQGRALAHAIEGRASRPLERLHRALDRTGLDIDLRLGVEYDDNIVQDQLGAPDPRDRKDWSTTTGLSVLERWPLRLGPVANETSYDLLASFHARNGEFDFIAHDLGHDVVLRQDFGRDHLRLSAGGRAVFLTRNTSRILDEKGWLLSGGYYLDAWRAYWLAEGWSKTLDYDRSFAQKAELDGTRDRLDLSVMHRLDQDHDDRLQLGYGLQNDRLQDRTRSFRERSLLLKWHNSHVPPVLTSLSPYYVLARRDYAAAEHGRIKRADSRQEYGLNLHRALATRNEFDLDLSWVANDSNRPSDEYGRARISLSWGYQL